MPCGDGPGVLCRAAGSASAARRSPGPGRARAGRRLAWSHHRRPPLGRVPAAGPPHLDAPGRPGTSADRGRPRTSPQSAPWPGCLPPLARPGRRTSQRSPPCHTRQQVPESDHRGHSARSAQPDEPADRSARAAVAPARPPVAATIPVPPAGLSSGPPPAARHAWAPFLGSPRPSPHLPTAHSTPTGRAPAAGSQPGGPGSGTGGSSCLQNAEPPPPVTPLGRW